MNCRKALELMGEHADGELHGWPRWRLRLHLLLCQVCRRYLSTYRTTIRITKLSQAVPEAESSKQVADDLVASIVNPRNPP